MNEVNIYKRIGKELVAEVITEFYERAFVDPLIGHFFFKKDKASLIKKQISFANKMLGDREGVYEGASLRSVHAHLPLRAVHFNRRQVLMEEVLSDLMVDKDLAATWLKLEGGLRRLVLSPGPTVCR